MKRRQFSGAMAASSLATALSPLTVERANAQQTAAFPRRALRLVVPWPAGGLVDLVGRALATRLAASLGQAVIVENRVGAAGAIGAEQVVRAAPDGHVLLLASSSLAIQSALKVKSSFQWNKDLTPIALVAMAPAVLLVSPNSPIQTVKDLIARARQAPGKLSYASAGTGSPAHMAAELFKSMTGTFAVHVPYTGAPAAINDQISGLIDFQFANLSVALPQVRAGRLRALAVTSVKRLSSLADIPTMSEAGLAGYQADQWLSLFAPAGVAAGILEQLAGEVHRTLQQDDMRNQLSQAGAVPAGSEAEPVASFLRSDQLRWDALVRKAQLKPD